MFNKILSFKILCPIFKSPVKLNDISKVNLHETITAIATTKGGTYMEKYQSNSGERLKQCIIDANMTQVELASASGFTQQYVSNIVVGKKPMTVKAASVFSKLLGVRQEYLLLEDDYKTQREFWGKRRSIFKKRDDIAMQLLNLCGYEPVCDFIENWEELGLDKQIYGPFPDGDNAGKHVPLELDTKTRHSTELIAPNGKHFYCDTEDIAILSYELIEYIYFRMGQLESKYAWRYDSGWIKRKSPGSETRFYKRINANENTDFLGNSIWVTHEEDYFPDISSPVFNIPSSYEDDCEGAIHKALKRDV